MNKRLVKLRCFSAHKSSLKPQTQPGEQGYQNKSNSVSMKELPPQLLHQSFLADETEGLALAHPQQQEKANSRHFTKP